MTRADHHAARCPARASTDDECECSWLIKPELPAERRYLLSRPEAIQALKDCLYKDPEEAP